MPMDKAETYEWERCPHGYKLPCAKCETKPAPRGEQPIPEQLVSDKELHWWAEGGSLIARELQQFRAYHKGEK